MVTLLARQWFADGAVVRRSREVARVLTGHGLESLVDHSGLGRFAPFRMRFGERPHLAQAARLRAALGELGVTFIKLGQTLSTRADLLPADVVAELAKLQDAAPRVPIEDIRRVIREDLGDDPAGLFASFDETPLASASIGQVHRARRHDGRDVAVKVRRPGVEVQVETDLQILRGIAEWAREHTRMGRDHDPVPLVEEFAHTLHGELDYEREADNAERFRRAFAGDPKVWIPAVHRDLTTHRVLTLELVTGLKITDGDALDRAGIPRRVVAENALRIFLREALEFGFFHADPHPGNFFVQPDGSLAILDFGMTGRLTEALQLHLLRAGLAAIRQDPESLAEELYALGVAGRNADRRAFHRDLDHLLGRYGGRSLVELSATEVTRELTSIAFRHRLQLPSELALLLRVIAMSEGIGLGLDPGFHYLEYAEPIFRRRWAALHALPATAKRWGLAAFEAAELGAQLPRRTGLLLGRLERGELQLSVHHEGLESLARQFQRMTNRLALAVILAASVVALGIGIGLRGGHGPLVEWLFRLGLVFTLGFGAALLWSMARAPRH